MKIIYQRFNKKTLLDKYLPDYRNLSKVDKSFFLNIVNTLDLGAIHKKIVECIKRRQLTKNDRREDYIELNEEFR